MANKDSYVSIGGDNKATSYVGPDAVMLARVMVLKSALNLAKNGIQANRGISFTRLLKMCFQYTGKSYSGKNKYDEAIADLDIWINTMKAAMPIERKDP